MLPSDCIPPEYVKYLKNAFFVSSISKLTSSPYKCIPNQDQKQRKRFQKLNNIHSIIIKM